MDFSLNKKKTHTQIQKFNIRINIGIFEECLQISIVNVAFTEVNFYQIPPIEHDEIVHVNRNSSVDFNKKKKGT